MMPLPEVAADALNNADVEASGFTGDQVKLALGYARTRMDFVVELL
jgi:hypothetical protein